MNIQNQVNRVVAALLVGVATNSAGAQVVNEDFKVLPDIGSVSDFFGHSIDIDNGIIAVGAYQDGAASFLAGSAYLFDAATGDQNFKLLATDASSFDFFGWSIALGDGVVAVGARGDDDNGADSGSVYLFDVATGAFLSKILPDDGASGDQFGYSVAIKNGILAVGAKNDSDNGAFSGSAYLFDVTTGVQLFKLLPVDGVHDDEFGTSVAIDNGFVVIGAHNAGDNGAFAGAAYIFDASTGAQLNKLLASDGAIFDRFGGSVAINNGLIAIGANGKDGSFNSSGAAYVYDVLTGQELTKLVPSFEVAGANFGWSIDIQNGVVVVGARFDTGDGPGSGSGYLFDAISGIQTHNLLPTDPTNNAHFGWSIALDNGLIVIGADNDDDNGTNSGSAYRFSVPPEPCPADFTGEGVLNFFDVSAFLQAFAAQDPIADFTGEGTFNFFDISAFLTAFQAGCP